MSDLAAGEQFAPLFSNNVSQSYKVIGVAVIWDNYGRVLIARRSSSKPLGGLWEFPGGKVEIGETVEDCIRREVQEELGIEVKVGKHLITVDYAYPHLQVSLTVHHCNYLIGEPTPIDCDEWRWVTIDELNSYSFPPANEQIILALK